MRAEIYIYMLSYRSYDCVVVKLVKLRGGEIGEISLPNGVVRQCVCVCVFLTQG